MTHCIVAFVQARLAEDESAARIIEPGGGHRPVTWRAEPASSGTWTHLVAEVRFVDDPPEIHEDYRVALVRDGRLEWDHIARHDPARVVRQVGAMRAIVAAHPYAGFLSAPEACGRCAAYPGPCPTLRHLALIWSDHPDYRGGWAP